MLIFNLSPEAALPVIFASVRKNGILLFANQETVSALSSIQILTGVYLAGVALPCLVTGLTIGREMGGKFAAKLIGKQLVFAVVFTTLLAWSAYFVN